MRLLATTEKQKNSRGFAVIILVWVIGVFIIGQKLAAKSQLDTGRRLTELKDSDQIFDEQRDLSLQIDELYHEIRKFRFEVFQRYLLEDLERRVKGIWKPKSKISRFSQRGMEVLKLLMFSRQELRKKEQNLENIGLDLGNCRDIQSAKKE